MSAELIGVLTVGVMLAGLILVVLNGLRSDINGLRTEMNGFRTQLNSFQTQLDGFRTQLDGFRTQLDGFREELNGFRAELAAMRRDFADLCERVARVEGLLDGLRESIRSAATGKKAAA